MFKCIVGFMCLIYIDMFECNEIEMCICVLDQVSDDYVMMKMTWRSGVDSVFPLLFRMEEVIHYS